MSARPLRAPRRPHLLEPDFLFPFPEGSRRAGCLVFLRRLGRRRGRGGGGCLRRTVGSRPAGGERSEVLLEELLAKGGRVDCRVPRIGRVPFLDLLRSRSTGQLPHLRLDWTARCLDSKTHLTPLVPAPNRPILTQHHPKLPLGPLRRLPFPLPELPQPLLELFLPFALGLAKLAEARVFRVRALKVAEVRAGGGDGAGEQLAVGGQGLLGSGRRR